MIKIRTQDRMGLFKCDGVYAYETKRDKLIQFAISNGKDILGFYRTQERALEVVDEIEYVTAQKDAVKRMDSLPKYCKPISVIAYMLGSIFDSMTAVYRMPKE